LIGKFTGALAATGKQFEVDKEVVTIREALAHGRLLTNDALPYRLWKFTKPRLGRVKIDFCEELSVEWLKGKSDMIDKQRQNVVDCFKARGYQGLR